MECFKHLLFNKISLYLLRLTLAAAFLFTSFAFLCYLLSSTKKEYTFNLIALVSNFILPAINLFESL